MPRFDSSGFEDIGAALRFLRLQAPGGAVKQKEVALRAGVTKGMLSSYERGKQEPSLTTLARLLEALGADLVRLDWALRMVGASPGSDPSALRPAPALPVPGGGDELGEEPVRWGSAEVAESAPAYGEYRLVRVPEPLSSDEEHALGQMLAGFLAYLRYTRAEPARGGGDAG